MPTAVSESSVVETSEAVISYREAGSGPAVLAIHGGGPGATGWGNWGGNVEDLRDRYRLIVPDQPGFGDSRLVKDSGEDYVRVSARALAELLTSLGVEKAHVFGNSLGGGVALRLALEHPELVDRLVLMGPYVYGFAPQLASPEPEGNDLLRYYYPDPTLERMQHLIRTFVHEPDSIPGLDAIIKSRYEATRNPDVEAGYKRMSSGTTPDPDTRSPWEKVSSITNKTLLMWGRDDKFCHLDDAWLFLSALENSELVVFRATGHWVQVERRPEFAAYVDAFLSR
jgi:2-hydroxy-6-oxonona-2,4-dienedioate hydrolase/4,5:9,10-diseco-3-hydroxy-5,9,17-trioxoandrosta-1(10),2-diene-4-oate hydrolase